MVSIQETVIKMFWYATVSKNSQKGLATENSNNPCLIIDLILVIKARFYQLSFIFLRWSYLISAKWFLF